jgi:hypothetical protein
MKMAGTGATFSSIPGPKRVLEMSLITVYADSYTRPISIQCKRSAELFKFDCTYGCPYSRQN